ncbi:hypothetical protein D3C71_1676700 [compost metagenome]
MRIRMRLQRLFFHPPLDHHLRQEADEAHAQTEKDHERAELARIRLARELQDDEHHEKNERSHPVGEKEVRKLLFCIPKNHNDKSYNALPGSGCSREGNAEASTRSR